MNLRILYFSLVVLAGCATGTSATRPAAPAPAAPSAEAVASESHAALPFIENDYAKALEEARRRELPLFVDVWAPW